MMEMIMSVLTNELVSRFISSLMNMYMDHPCSKEKQMERLQLLLLRVHTVVEEADGRYTTNSGMLLQLKMLVETMYSGYDALDSVKCHQLINEVIR